MGQNFRTILCADDDPGVLERLKEHFTLQGFVVITASNGVEAALQVKRWAPTAVILDLFIPRLGGIGTLSRIRAFNPRLPVILVSDTADALELVTAAGLNVAGAFAKPLNLDQISDALARAGVLAPAALDIPSIGPRRRGRTRILLVDDVAEFRDMLAEYLGGRGFEVLEAGSGEEALRQVSEGRPHVVLLDLMMDGIGGLETLQRIKLVCPESCVIMVTAAEDLDTARGALANGAADYLTKPFTFQYLDAVLDIHMTPDWMAPRSVEQSRLAAQLNGQVVAEAASMVNAQHVIAAL